MKKLLTLVLALVMVFAVAVPAMAMTDEALGTVSSTNDNYSLEIALYQASAADAADNATFTLPAVQGANRAYVANENVYFGIKLAQKENVSDPAKLPKMMKITSTYGATIKAAKQALVKTDGKVEVVACATDLKADSDGKATNLFPGYVAVKSTTADNKLSLKGEALYFFGEFVNGSKAFSVKVEIKPVFEMATGTQYSLGDDLWAAKIADNQYVVSYGAVATQITNQIAFTMDDVGRVKEMGYYDGAATYATTLSATTALEYDQAYDGNTTGLDIYWNVGNKKADAGQLNAIDRAFKKMGFDVTKQNTNAVKEKHFIAKIAGVHLEAEVKGEYYTAVVTIPDVTVVEPPKTGDASTVAGFVMIAAAIVAALGLAYNKVRA